MGHTSIIAFDRIARFGFVGAINSGVYIVVAALAAGWAGLPPLAASVVAYLAALPIAFLGHKNFTFRSDGAVVSEATRFLITYIAGLLAAMFAMYLSTDIFGLSYWFGIFGAVVLVPLSSYAAMALWVFRTRH